MTRLGATVRLLEHGINLNTSECVDCGACISICPRKVFSFDSEWKLAIVEDRCVLCGKCVDACPHKALSLPYDPRAVPVRETFAAILAETPVHAAAAKEGMIAARLVLEGYIARDPFFASTFSPYAPETDEPLIRDMAAAASAAEVRPMATVAGAIAAAGIDAMMGRCPVRSDR